MAIKFSSNRRLHDRNTKAVSVAQDRIKTVSPIAQERYYNAFVVNGFPCIVYTKLNSGIKCSCTQGVQVSNITPVLDENGNATQSNLQSILTDSHFSVDDYGTSPNNDINGNLPLRKDVMDTENLEYEPHSDSDNPFTTDTEADLNATFLEMQSDFRSTKKCGVCFGSSFVGGYYIHNGSRIVLATTHNSLLYNATIDGTEFPHKFTSLAPTAYVELETIIPAGAISLDSFSVFNNMEKIYNMKVFASTDNWLTEVELNDKNLMNFATGLPLKLRVKDFNVFTHIELQFNLSNIPTYLEYPRFQKTADLNLVDATQAVQIIVSGLVYQIDAWDIIVDLHDRNNPRYWRVTDASSLKDRNAALYGWEINARIIQPYEVYTNLPWRKNATGQDVTTKLPRF